MERLPEKIWLYKEDEDAKPEDMVTYYSIEDINKYDVLGIEIKVI